MSREKLVPTLSAWPVKDTERTFFVRVENLYGYRAKPYKFMIDGRRIVLADSTIRWKNFGVLYGQICYMIRKANATRDKVVQIINREGGRQRKTHKRPISRDAYAHQLICDKRSQG